MKLGELRKLTGECSHGLFPGDQILIIDLIRTHETMAGYSTYRILSRLGCIDVFLRYIHDSTLETP